MVHGVVGAAHVVGDLLVRLRLLARGQLAPRPRRHGRLGDDLPGQPDAGHRDGHVVALRVGEVARVHGRLVPVVVGAQAQGAAGLGEGWTRWPSGLGCRPLVGRHRCASSRRGLGGPSTLRIGHLGGDACWVLRVSGFRGRVGAGGWGCRAPWPPGLWVPWAGERRFLPPEAKTLPVLPPEQGRARFLPTERAGLPVLPTERGRCGTPPPRWARR